MEEENTMLTTGEADGAESAVELDGAFDAGWGDDDLPGGAEEGTAEEDQDDFDGDGGSDDEAADQPAAEELSGEESGGPNQKSTDAGKTDESPDQGEAFVLRHLGEERSVGRDEVVTLAQKGLDYDRIREKWDSVKDDVPKLRMYEDFLRELAEARGGDIESLIDETRTRTLIARAKAEGRDPDPAAAAAEAVRIRLKGGVPDTAKRAETPEADGQARMKEAVDRFIGIYGNTVKSGDIPPEVWDEAQRTGDLIGPYQKHLAQKQEAEISKLRKELEQAKQQKKNRERSTGSARSEGASASRDPFDEGWDTPI